VNLERDFTKTGGALHLEKVAVGMSPSLSARLVANSQSIGGVDAGIKTSPQVTSTLVELAASATGCGGFSGALGAVRRIADQSESGPTPAALRAQTRNLYRLSGCKP